jgi:hypothetical protein
MATASRSKAPGEPGSATLDQLVPPLVERKTPSLHPARISSVLAVPVRAIDTDHVVEPRRWVQPAPAFVET